MERIDSLILSFLNDEIAPEDFAELKTWAFADEENSAYIRKYIELWFSSYMVSEENRFDSNAAFSRFRARVSESDNRAGKPEVKRSRKRANASRGAIIKKAFWVVAATVAVLLIVAPFATYHLGRESTKELFGLVQLTAPSGSTLDLILPDGTIVKLNSSSKLSYSQGFGITDRVVTLDGEAYFEVRHDERMPFKVNGDRLEVTDIGTTFTICNYAVKETATINLVEGKICVKALVNNAELTLDPGLQLKIDKTNGLFYQNRVQHAGSRNAAFDIYVFENEPIEDIAARLAQLYDVEIIVDENLKGAMFYGSIDRKQQTIEQVLDVLEKTEHLRYRKEGKTYYLY